MARMIEKQALSIPSNQERGPLLLLLATMKLRFGQQRTVQSVVHGVQSEAQLIVHELLGERKLQGLPHRIRLEQLPRHGAWSDAVVFAQIHQATGQHKLILATEAQAVLDMQAVVNESVGNIRGRIAEDRALRVLTEDREWLLRGGRGGVGELQLPIRRRCIWHRDPAEPQLCPVVCGEMCNKGLQPPLSEHDHGALSGEWLPVRRVHGSFGAAIDQFLGVFGHDK